MAEVTLEQCDQWRERIIDRWPNISTGWADAFSEYVARAVTEEREQCALAAEMLARDWCPPTVPADELFPAEATYNALRAVAATIRASNQEPRP